MDRAAVGARPRVPPGEAAPAPPWTDAARNLSDGATRWPGRPEEPTRCRDRRIPGTVPQRDGLRRAGWRLGHEEAQAWHAEWEAGVLAYGRGAPWRAA